MRFHALVQIALEIYRTILDLKYIYYYLIFRFYESVIRILTLNLDFHAEGGGVP